MCFVAVAVVAVALTGLRTAYAETAKLVIKRVSERPALNKRIVVEVEGLSEWSDAERELKNAMLYLNGQPIIGASPLVDKQNNRLVFDLQRTDKSKAAWAVVLGSPGFSVTRRMPLNIGFENGALLASDYPVEFVIFQQGWQLWLSLALFLLALVLFFWLVRKSDILRDTGPRPPGGARRPYSLGRSQMAFWFFLVMGSYLLIWLITGDRNAMPGSVLGLMGISAATALGAAFVDFGKRQGAASELESLRGEETSLKTRIAQLESLQTPSQDEQRELAEKRGRLVQVTQKIEQLSAATSGVASENFVKDIMTDATGISLHRFQIVVWTLVLGLVFCTEVYHSLAMPEFNETLLALMGISAGTYLGFKFPEKQT